MNSASVRWPPSLWAAVTPPGPSLPELTAPQEAEVVVIGAGFTGLSTALHLREAGVDVAIVERRSSQELDGSRAGGLHARTLEVLDQRGIADRFVSQGQKHRGETASV